jgi:hypothetical protein
VDNLLPYNIGIHIHHGFGTGKVCVYLPEIVLLIILNDSDAFEGAVTQPLSGLISPDDVVISIESLVVKFGRLKV